MCALLIKTDKEEDFKSFARRFFSDFQVQGYEVRYSENWAGGEYVRGFSLGIKVTISLADSAEFPDYHIALNLAPVHTLGADARALDGVGDVIARRLALEGYQVVREFGPYIGDPHAHYVRKFPSEAADADKLEVRVLPYPKAGSQNT